MKKKKKEREENKQEQQQTEKNEKNEKKKNLRISKPLSPSCNQRPGSYVSGLLKTSGKRCATAVETHTLEPIGIS